MQAHAAAAAYRASCDYDPSREVPFSAFLYLRIIHSALTYYRHEWGYAAHCIVSTDAEYDTIPTENMPAIIGGYEVLGYALAQLSECDRWLIEQLFWTGQTEAALAQQLGISQRGVSKRKQAILRKMYTRLETQEENGDESK